MKTFLKVLNVVAWTFALIAAVLGNTTGAMVMAAMDDEDDAEDRKKK